jgi:hypothetical protein
MRVADADGRPRISEAADLVRQLVPALSGRFTTEIYGVGDSPSPASPDDLSAVARQSDLTRAVASIRDKYRGRAVAGIIVVSDGGDTGHAPDLAEGPPIFAVGVGSPEGVKDREILGVTTGDPRLDQSSVDLQVSVASSRYGRTPFDLRLLSNGKLLESRKVAPAADGSPIEAMFTVSPDPQNATVYTVEVQPEPDEVITENNTRSVLVNPAGRRRKILLLAGSPGYEHSFLTRALTLDAGLETDVVVKKGKNESGEGTFLVQAGSGRASTLTAGFRRRVRRCSATTRSSSPTSRRLLYTRAADVGCRIRIRRGGGLLVLGGRSFTSRGLIGTARSCAPVELNDRRAGLASSRGDGELPPAHNAVTLTAEGEHHPVTRIGSSIEQTRDLWAALFVSRQRAAWRPETGRERAGRDRGARRRGLSGNCGPALRARPLDDLRGRSVVALADDAPVRGSFARILLAPGGSMAGRTSARDGHDRGAGRRGTGRLRRHRRGRARQRVQAGAGRDRHRDAHLAGRKVRSGHIPARSREQRPLHRGDSAGESGSLPGVGRCAAGFVGTRAIRAVVLRRRRRSRIHQSAIERRLAPQNRAAVRRPLRARGRRLRACPVARERRTDGGRTRRTRCMERTVDDSPGDPRPFG